MNSKLLDIIIEIAKGLILSGAEISRVEESISRICSSYGCKCCDVYATTSQIVVTVKCENEEFLTIQRRIASKSAGTDIEKLDKLNNLVRNITKDTPDVESIIKDLKEIQDIKRKNKYILPLFYGIIATCFCVFFGSRKINEAVISFFIGFTVGILSLLFEKLYINKILSRFVLSFVAAVLVRFSIKLNLAQNPDYIIIGNIMSLIPGIGLTNALRDLFTGDMITGILRSIEALLLTVAIALGFALPSIISGGVI